jgi:CelD/BcsL family acetyltransferase involved in cellulose biosynthesis
MSVTDGLDARWSAPSSRSGLSWAEYRTRCATDPFAFTVIADRADFAALEQEWNSLFARAGRPHQLFQAYDWLRLWADHYLDERTRLSIVTARQRGRLVMIWPLVATRRAGLTGLCWMGEPVSQYGDALVEDGPERSDLLSQGWAFVKSLGADFIHLRKTREDAVVFALLQEAGARSIATAAAPYLDLASAPDYETYQQRYPAKQRARRRSLLRRLQERGSVVFERPGSGPATDLVVQALQLKQKWLMARGVVAPVLQDSRFGRFLLDAANRGGTPAVRVCAVCCNGETAAVEVSLECKNHRVAYLISYDIALAPYGVGVIAAEDSIRSAHASGLARFDLLTPADAYKLQWSDASVEVHDWAMPFSPAGKIYVSVWLAVVKERMKRAVKKWPAWLRRSLAGLYRWRHAAAPVP